MKYFEIFYKEIKFKNSKNTISLRLRVKLILVNMLFLNLLLYFMTSFNKLNKNKKIKEEEEFQ